MLETNADDCIIMVKEDIMDVQHDINEKHKWRNVLDREWEKTLIERDLGILVLSDLKWTNQDY